MTTRIRARCPMTSARAPAPEPRPHPPPRPAGVPAPERGPGRRQGRKGEETGDELRGRGTGVPGNHTSRIHRHRSNMSLRGIVSPTFSYRKTSGIKTGVPGSSAARVRRHLSQGTPPGRPPPHRRGRNELERPLGGRVPDRRERAVIPSPPGQGFAAVTGPPRTHAGDGGRPSTPRPPPSRCRPAKPIPGHGTRDRRSHRRDPGGTSTGWVRSR